jgi:hypothetical protein
MKIYLTAYGEYEDYHITGAFSSLGLAKEWQLINNVLESEIVEFELDKPPQQFPCVVCVFSNGFMTDFYCGTTNHFKLGKGEFNVNIHDNIDVSVGGSLFPDNAPVMLARRICETILAQNIEVWTPENALNIASEDDARKLFNARKSEKCKQLSDRIADALNDADNKGDRKRKIKRLKRQLATIEKDAFDRCANG